MGLFSDDKETYVSSFVYNLAGEEDSRPKPLKAAILRNVVSNSSQSLSDALVNASIQGPGKKQRQFFNWAVDNYSLGMPTGQIQTDDKLKTTDIKNALVGVIAGATAENLEVITGTVDKADGRYWAEAWIAQNKPDKLNTPWGISIEVADPNNYYVNLGIGNGSHNLVINFSDETTASIDVPANLAWGKKNDDRRLLYVTYNLITVDPETLIASVDGPYLFTYRLGSGVVALDNLIPVSEAMEQFYPAIPLRLFNKYVSEYPDKSSDLYKSSKKAYNKLTGSDIEDMLTQIDDNPDIAKIDYAMLVQGVPLNTKEQMGQRYLFEFFETLMAGSTTSSVNYNQLDPEIVEGIVNTNLRNRWKSANVSTISVRTGGEGETKQVVNPIFSENNPNFGTPRPESEFRFQYTNQSKNLIIKMPELDSFHYFMEWESITKHDHIGNMKRFDNAQTRDKANVGEYWIVEGPPAWTYRLLTETIPGTEGEQKETWKKVQVPRLFLLHQYAKRRYSSIEVIGLHHRNYVWSYYAVRTSMSEAMASEEDSRFIIPLHFPTVKKLGLSRANELANSSSYLVFNTLETVTIKWYQKGFFKVLLVFAAVATAAFTGGFSIVGGSGLLGANTAIGLSVGASVASAALVGAAVNFIAASLVTALIQYAAEEVIGGALGAIIGTIASFIAIQYGSQFAATGNFNVDWGSLMRVDNIMKITDSVTGAYTQWMQGETEGIIREIKETTEDYNEQTEKIRELSEEILGMTHPDFDPMMLIDATEYFGESSEAFLNRTLLTGSDIANLSHAMIEHFAPTSLELPRAISK